MEKLTAEMHEIEDKEAVVDEIINLYGQDEIGSAKRWLVQRSPRNPFTLLFLKEYLYDNKSWMQKLNLTYIDTYLE